MNKEQITPEQEHQMVVHLQAKNFPKGEDSYDAELCDTYADGMREVILNPSKYGLSTAVKHICDGCNVREPHEHRCHKHNIVERGEITSYDCDCERCNSVTPVLSEDLKLKLEAQDANVEILLDQKEQLQQRIAELESHQLSEQEIKEEAEKLYPLKQMFPATPEGDFYNAEMRKLRREYITAHPKQHTDDVH